MHLQGVQSHPVGPPNTEIAIGCPMVNGGTHCDENGGPLTRRTDGDGVLGTMATFRPRIHVAPGHCVPDLGLSPSVGDPAVTSTALPPCTTLEEARQVLESELRKNFQPKDIILLPTTNLDVAITLIRTLPDGLLTDGF